MWSQDSVTPEFTTDMPYKALLLQFLSVLDEDAKLKYM